MELAGDHAAVSLFVAGVEVEVEDAFVFAAKKCEDAVGGQTGEGFGEVEVVGEFGSFLFFSFYDLAFHGAGCVHGFAEFADEVGVEGEAVDEDGAGSVEGFFGVVEAVTCVGGCELGGVGGGVVDELFE